MKRIIVLLIFLTMCVLSIMYTSGTLLINGKVDRCINCTYCPSDIKCGQFYISDTLDTLTFGQSVIVNELDIDKLIADNHMKVVTIECLEGQIVYLLYTDTLPKYRLINNMKYNIQVSVKGGTTKVGYPAIFDSF